MMTLSNAYYDIDRALPSVGFIRLIAAFGVIVTVLINVPISQIDCI